MPTSYATVINIKSRGGRRMSLVSWSYLIYSSPFYQGIPLAFLEGILVQRINRYEKLLLSPQDCYTLLISLFSPVAEFGATFCDAVVTCNSRVASPKRAAFSAMLIHLKNISLIAPSCSFLFILLLSIVKASASFNVQLGGADLELPPFDHPVQK